MGVVNWLGYDWQQNDALVMLMHHAEQIEATLASSSLISTDWLCLRVVQMSRCRDLIGNFCGDNDRQLIKPIILKIDHNLA